MTMSEFKERKFAEICQLFDGPHATPAPSDNGPIFLGIKSISPDGKIKNDGIRHISWDQYPMWTKRVTPQEGDIVFSYEATLHQYCLIPKGFVGCLGRRMALLRVNPIEINNIFLYYYLQSAKWREYITPKIIHGSTVDRISIKDFPEYSIQLPDRDLQDKIATIISAYDDLIENNICRITILEEMAQKLYHEWFVNFRFPGHKKIKMVESELGMIPNGWQVVRFDSIAKFIKGKKANESTSVHYGNLVPNILLDAVASGTYSYVIPDKMVMADRNDIIMVMDGASSGKVIRGEYGAIGSTLAKIETKSQYKNLLYTLLLSNEKEISDNNTGSAIPHANKNFINMKLVCIPPSDILNRYDKITNNITLLMQNLKAKNTNLRKTRDLLLPRLISGNIDVSNLDILVREE